MKFSNMIDKGRWPRGPWNIEPDLVLFQVRRRGHVYTCVIKRDRGNGVLCGYILISNDHPLAGQNAAGMALTLALDAGLSLGHTYALSHRQPPRSVSPSAFDPAHTYFTVAAWKEILLTKVTELDEATRVEQDRTAARVAGTLLPPIAVAETADGDDIFSDDEDYDDDDEEREEEDEDIIVTPGMIHIEPTLVSADMIFSAGTTQPTQPR